LTQGRSTLSQITMNIRHVITWDLGWMFAIRWKNA